MFDKEFGTAIIRDLAKQAAAQSPCKKRKVGAVVLTNLGRTYIGWNHNGDKPCENIKGNTLPEVVHAEIDAINAYRTHSSKDEHAIAIYVTHQPCSNCTKTIADIGITETIIVDDFMKFDSGKATFELLPKSVEVVTRGLTSLTRAVIEARNSHIRTLDLASDCLAHGRSAPVVANAINAVLKYGAKKYKPNNWRNVDNIDRYWDALMRHCQAIELGEVNDPESGLPHTDHALCNIAFLIELSK